MPTHDPTTGFFRPEGRDPHPAHDPKLQIGWPFQQHGPTDQTVKTPRGRESFDPELQRLLKEYDDKPRDGGGAG